MLRHGEYTIEILGMPSGQVIQISRLSYDELKKLNLIKYRRYIKMYGEERPVHGWVFNDNNLEQIENIDKEY